MVTFQFLVVANQAIIDLASHIICIEISVKLKKKNLESIDWNRVLRLSCNDVNLSSNLSFQKIDKLINLWAPFQVQSNPRKISQNEPWITKGILKSIGTENRLYKKICRLKWNWMQSKKLQETSA